MEEKENNNKKIISEILNSLKIISLQRPPNPSHKDFIISTQEEFKAKLRSLYPDESRLEGGPDQKLDFSHIDNFIKSAEQKNLDFFKELFNKLYGLAEIENILFLESSIEARKENLLKRTLKTALRLVVFEEEALNKIPDITPFTNDIINIRKAHNFLKVSLYCLDGKDAESAIEYAETAIAIINIIQHPEFDRACQLAIASNLISRACRVLPEHIFKCLDHTQRVAHYHTKGLYHSLTEMEAVKLLKKTAKSQQQIDSIEKMIGKIEATLSQHIGFIISALVSSGIYYLNQASVLKNTKKTSFKDLESILQAAFSLFNVICGYKRQVKILIPFEDSMLGEDLVETLNALIKLIEYYLSFEETEFDIQLKIYCKAMSCCNFAIYYANSIQEKFLNLDNKTLKILLDVENKLKILEMDFLINSDLVQQDNMDNNDKKNNNSKGSKNKKNQKPRSNNSNDISDNNEVDCNISPQSAYELYKKACSHIKNNEFELAINYLSIAINEIESFKFKFNNVDIYLEMLIDLVRCHTKVGLLNAQELDLETLYEKKQPYSSLLQGRVILRAAENSFAASEKMLHLRQTLTSDGYETFFLEGDKINKSCSENFPLIQKKLEDYLIKIEAEQKNEERKSHKPKNKHTNKPKHTPTKNKPKNRPKGNQIPSPISIGIRDCKLAFEYVGNKFEETKKNIEEYNALSSNFNHSSFFKPAINNVRNNQHQMKDNNSFGFK